LVVQILVSYFLHRSFARLIQMK